MNRWNIYMGAALGVLILASALLAAQTKEHTRLKGAEGALSCLATHQRIQRAKEAQRLRYRMEKQAEQGALQ